VATQNNGSLNNKKSDWYSQSIFQLNETKERLRKIAPGGGLILGPVHNVQPQVSVEKLLAFYDTVKKSGGNPIWV
jgi:hypothetical protein